MTHKEAARNVASVHICPSITRTDIRVNYTLYGRRDIPSGSNQSVDGWKRWESQRITFVDFSALLVNSLTALTSTGRTANRGKTYPSYLQSSFSRNLATHGGREYVQKKTASKTACVYRCIWATTRKSEPGDLMTWLYPTLLLNVMKISYLVTSCRQQLTVYDRSIQITDDKTLATRKAINYCWNIFQLYAAGVKCANRCKKYCDKRMC